MANLFDFRHVRSLPAGNVNTADWAVPDMFAGRIGWLPKTLRRI